VNFSPAHLRRYKQIATLFWKYGRSDLMKHMAVDDAFDVKELKPAGDETEPGDVKAEQLADDLEAMGPTYVKLGQILAGRPDLLPDAYLKALARLQDKVKPFPYEEVEKIVLSELGSRISKAFSVFGTIPLAAASLGQVHQAALRDGTPVVVKVQRPEIRPMIAEDFEVLAEIAAFLEERTEFGRKHRLTAILAEFRTALQQELNYELEEQNLISPCPTTAPAAS
jgi:ubiquinone biosynthesis protein